MDNPKKLSSCEKTVFIITIILIALIVAGVIAYIDYQNGGSTVAPSDMWFNGGTRDLI